MVPAHVPQKTPRYLVLGPWPGWSAIACGFPSLCAFVPDPRLEEPSGCFPGVYLWVLCYHRNGDPCRLGAGQPGCGGQCLHVSVHAQIHTCTRVHVQIHTCTRSVLFGRQFLDVRATHLSPRQCEDSYVFAGGQ